MKGVSAIIASAGYGRRMGLRDRKQYIHIGGRPVLAHTISVFEGHRGIESILLVVPEDDIGFCKREIVDRYSFKKVKDIVPGGKERQDSIRNGLNAISGSGIVVIHDGVRPFVTDGMVEGVLQAALEYGAAVIGVPVRETTKHVSEDGWIIETVDRENLWLIQTPQAFDIDWIRDAHDMALKRGLFATDDSGLVEWMGKRVKVVEGSVLNIKITTRDDLKLAEALLNVYNLDVAK